MGLMNTRNGIWGSMMKNASTKARYKFPFGDFEKVHRCGVLSAESRAGQYKHHEIELAAAHLHGMIDEMKH
jgi:hypothetical protein